MLRLVLTILVLLSSGLAAGAATGHGIGMAIAESAPALHAIHGPDRAPGDVTHCAGDGDCRPDAALCRWSCSGLVGIIIAPAPRPEMIRIRTVRGQPGLPTHDGIAPPGLERPPRRLPS